MSKDQTKRSEKAGLMRLFREMGSALIMALIAIVYVIQAFKIPTGSMEDSLLVGDFLLGLKFVYGAPILPYSQELGITARLPALADPKAGDVVIFKYPGTDRKDYIKRTLAGPGSVVEIKDKQVFVDGEEVLLPPEGKYMNMGGKLDRRISNYTPLKIPAKNDVLNAAAMPVREFLFFKHLVRQENPRRDVTIGFSLHLDGEYSNNVEFPFFNTSITFNDLQNGKVPVFSRRTNRYEPFDFNKYDDWVELDNFITLIRNNIEESYPEKELEIVSHLYIDNQEVGDYTVRFDNYFMIGDNRNNSMDSRYWGYLNRNYVKAKAFILYLSLDSYTFPWVRWDRLGQLIRSWDGGVNSRTVTEAN